MARGGGQIGYARQAEQVPQNPLQILGGAIQQGATMYDQHQTEKLKRQQMEAEMYAKRMEQERLRVQGDSAVNELRNFATGGSSSQALGSALPDLQRNQIDRLVAEYDDLVSRSSGTAVSDRDRMSQDAMLSHMRSQAVSMQGDLRDRVERAHKADTFENMMLQEIAPTLAEDERGTFDQNVRSLGNLMRAGVQDAALSDVVQRTMPNMQERVQMANVRSQIRQAETGAEADARATPYMTRMLAESATTPEEREMWEALSASGVSIWGAGSELLKLGASREESGRFLANAARSHQMALDEIDARSLAYGQGGGGGGFGSVESRVGTLMNTAINRTIYGYTNLENDARRPVGPDGMPNISVALEELIAELRPSGYITPQVEAALRVGGDEGLWGDVMYYQSKGATRQDWNEIMKGMREAGRTEEHIRAVGHWLYGGQGWQSQ